MTKQKYDLEVYDSGKRIWRLRASFLEGEMSRRNKPFDANEAVQEAKDFIRFWENHKPTVNIEGVRIVIEI